MTALCGGGTSSASAAFGGGVWFTAAAITSFLENRIDHNLASFLGPILAGTAAIASTFCDSDPPASPTINASDFVDLLPTADPVAQLAAASKVSDWFLHQYWCVVCKCDSGTIPSCSGTTLPATPIGNDNGLPPAGASSPCWDYSSTFTYTQPHATDPNSLDLSAQFLPTSLGTMTINPSGLGITTTTAYLLPAGVTGCTITTTQTSGGHFQDSHLWYDTFSAAGALVHAGNASRTNADSGVITITPNMAGSPAAMLISALQEGANTFNVDTVAHTVFACGSTTLVQPCCPPDASTQYDLTAMLTMVRGIYQQTTLTQRYLLPFAYVIGAAHSGLSGQGSFAVSRLLGMKIELTTIPSGYGQTLGTPTFHFDMGWVSILTGDGLILEQKITAATQLWQPQHFPEALTFGYSFSPGIVATCTEVEAEV